MFQRLIGHDGPKIGATDADIDDVFDALSRVAFPMAVADAPRKVGHLVEHRMHLRHHIPAIHINRFALRRTKRDMQSRPPLGHIDFLAPEHGADPGAQAGLFRQIEQEA